ncbi:HAD family hydrolase [Leptotrichia sp. oral taxon 879]|uniref:KdsC family phosphatase n=1 Tax=Leptotrichia sp. oral taxon 879 TaxID=1227267 RepID=UPI0003AD81AF|nr:HAD-IIIA family hydrolase [Leptotrichia sp. oral taxon 879]ERK53640.1 3-deoxy-D-manno-octulosonate 8-phosphate phosphatase, YrbI family [Leptotrichia sp. oral taxon 879 str. F0557]
MIKLILLDVDGTLTDGGIYLGNSGEELKKFNVKDGYAILNAQKLGIEFGIITGAESELLKKRAEKLNIKYLYQGISEKTIILDEIMQISGLQKEEIAYMGDDLNDIKIMKKSGFSGTPLDGVNEAKIIADFVSTKNGGEGAVREFIEIILKRENLFQKFLANVK